MMKIALTRGNSENSTPPQDIPSIMKKTYQIKTAKLVPVFAARWRSICKYSSNSENRQITNKARKTNSSKKTATHLSSVHKPEENLEQSSQSHYNSQFNLNKQAYAQYKNTLQKEQSDAPCNFIKLYHLYLMKIALIKKNQQEKRQHHLKISSIRNEDDLSHQKREGSSKFRR
jgi:hypothetical protein